MKITRNGTGEPLLLDGEQWRDIEGWPNYQVSNFGRVKSLARVSHRFNPRWGVNSPLTVKEKILKEGRFYGTDRRGMKRPKPAATLVGVLVDGERVCQYVHILVLNAFVGPCPEGMEGCHEDGNGLNNHIDNLRWDTHAANMQDSMRHGTFYPKRFQIPYTKQRSTCH